MVVALMQVGGLKPNLSACWTPFSHDSAYELAIIPHKNLILQTCAFNFLAPLNLDFLNFLLVARGIIFNNLLELKHLIRASYQYIISFTKLQILPNILIGLHFLLQWCQQP
jgi:hypothetical protein